MTQLTDPKPRGGPRPNSGRRPGSKNAATLKREKLIKQGVEAAMAAAGNEQHIENADPHEALKFALRAYWKAANLQGLVAVARELMPYTMPKISSAEPMMPLPADLLGDPEPAGDEPGPKSPIL